MPGVTPNYNLTTYSAADIGVKFFTFRIAIAGSQETSNFYVIDKVLGQFRDSIVELQNQAPVTYVSAQAVPGIENYYEAQALNYTRYTNNEVMVMNINQNSGNAVTININSLGTREVVKYNSEGVLVPLSSGDWRANADYLVVNLGTQWVWVGATSADQINIAGTPGNAASISPNNTLTDSGRGFGTANGIATTNADNQLVEALQPNSVNTININNGAVDNTKLSANAVNTTNIVDGAVTNPKLSANAVGTTNIADGAVTTGKIANQNVTVDKMAANSVGTNQIVNLNVTTDKLAEGAVTINKIAANTIEGVGDARYLQLTGGDISGSINFTGSSSSIFINNTMISAQSSPTTWDSKKLLINASEIQLTTSPTPPAGTNTTKITNMANPTSDMDAANKRYVDGLVSPLNSSISSLTSRVSSVETTANAAMPKSGGTFTGGVTIKNGTSAYGGKLNFGDGDYVHLYESTDDKLEIKSKDTTFAGPARSTDSQAMGTAQFRNIIVYASGTDINSVATPPAGTFIAILE